MTAPLSLIVSAFAPVSDVRRVLTPQLRLDQGETVLLLLDLGRGHNRLGGSAFAQVQARLGGDPPDLDDPALLRGFFDAIQALNQRGLLLAYHDRSDGGLLATLCEMAFAGRCGLEIDLDKLLEADTATSSDASPQSVLFNEELGVVVQLRVSDLEAVEQRLDAEGLAGFHHRLGHPVSSESIQFRAGEHLLFSGTRAQLQGLWSETSWQLQRLRDNPDCADEAYARIQAPDSGLQAKLTFDPSENPAATLIATGARPRMAILREQGVNGQLEMAAAFDRAGFECVDLHMSDLLDGRLDLEGFRGLVACGGFSFGDVLGAGEGWAKRILFNPQLRDQFAAFFAREDSFALGVCNGCQMLSNLRELIPGSDHWPHFGRNRSEQFEARLSLVEVVESPSILLRGMAGSRMPIAVAHGEGRAEFRDQAHLANARTRVALRYVENLGEIAERYPANPNGSPEGITGLTTDDGRVTIMMPHPERVFRAVQHSWRPDDWVEDGPWLRLFRNARIWVG